MAAGAARLGGRCRHRTRPVRAAARQPRSGRGGEEADHGDAAGAHLRAPAARRRSPSRSLRRAAVATSDVLYVVEDLISEHYCIADDKSSTFTARARSLMDTWRTAGDEDPHWRSPRERFTSSRTALVAQLVAHQAEAASLSGSTTPIER